MRPAIRSMRAAVVLRQAGIACEEIVLRMDSFAADSAFKRAILALNPAGKVKL